MASLTVENIQEDILSRLRSLADANGTSIEEEAARIIKRELASENSGERTIQAFREGFGLRGGAARTGTSSRS